MCWAWAAKVVVKISSRVFLVRLEEILVVCITWTRIWKQVAEASVLAEGVDMEEQMSLVARGSVRKS